MAEFLDYVVLVVNNYTAAIILKKVKWNTGMTMGIGTHSYHLGICQ